MLKAKFDRVAGPETGGAGLYPDTISVWLDHSVGMPTSPDGIHRTSANHGDPVLKIGPPGSIDAVHREGQPLEERVH